MSDTNIILITGGFTLLAAFLAGLFSYLAAVHQTNIAEEVRKEEFKLREKERERLAVAIISQFLLGEIKHNINQLDILNRYYQQERSKWPQVMLPALRFKEYEKIKYELIKMNSNEVEKVIKAYHLFDIIHEAKRLNDFKEEDIIYIIKRMKNTKTFVESLETNT